ncbi:MAG: DNA replication/repair protein RecF [Verrucomicrobiia bacterium]
MFISYLKLRNFRNYSRVDVGFNPGLVVFVGNNAQGKTNMLEAIYFLATVKSFRGATIPQLIRHSQRNFFLEARVHSDVEHNIKVFCSREERKFLLDNNPIRRVKDIYGIVKAVVFCSEDIMLVKGTARNRRRYLDYILANTASNYLDILQNYSTALRNRNHILKQTTIDLRLLESFTVQLIRYGNELMKYRSALIKDISPSIELAYRKISAGSDEIKLEYRPSIKGDFSVELANIRDREFALKTTIVGPHRDDLAIYLNDKLAADYGSEGQIRSAAIALKLGQAEYFSLQLGVPPILLVDDIIGELDRNRREAFLPLLERSHRFRSQVFMTCTEQNVPSELHKILEVWRVFNGTLQKLKLDS